MCVGGGDDWLFYGSDAIDFQKIIAAIYKITLFAKSWLKPHDRFANSNENLDLSSKLRIMENKKTNHLRHVYLGHD